MFWNKTDALELIELTYALLDEEDGFQDLFQRLSELFGDAMYSVQMWDRAIEVDNERLYHAGYDDKAKKAYLEHFYSVNPFLPIIGQHSSGDVNLLSELIPQERHPKLEFLADFQYPLGNYAGVTATLLKDDNRYGAFSIDGPSYTPQRWKELKALVEVMTPHLQRVMHLSRQLQRSALYLSVADASMERVSAAMMVVSRSGKLAFANTRAMEMIYEGRFLKIDVAGHVSANSTSQNRKLRALISSSTMGDYIVAESSGGFLTLEDEEGRQMVAMISPLERAMRVRLGLANEWSSLRKLAVIFLADPDSQTRLPNELLIMHYRLTRKEADLALHLFGGGTLAQYCDTKHVTMNTARTQLKAIFLKTGVSRQGELIALLNRLSVFAEN